MNEEREEVSLEMKLWMAGYESALDHLERSSRKILKELGKLRNYIPFDGFRAVLEADIRGLHSYRNGWDGLPRPDYAAAIEQIREILAAAEAWSRGSLLADFMDMTPGEKMSDKLEWIRAAKERVWAPERVEEAVQAALDKIIDDVGYGAPEAWELTREKIRGRLERMAEWLLQDPDLDLESERAPGRIPLSDERFGELVWAWYGSGPSNQLSDAEMVSVIASGLPPPVNRPALLLAWRNEDPKMRSIAGPILAVRFMDGDHPAGRVVLHPVDESIDLAGHATKLERWEHLGDVRAAALAKLTEEERAALGLDG